MKRIKKIEGDQLAIDEVLSDAPVNSFAAGNPFEHKWVNIAVSGGIRAAGRKRDRGTKILIFLF